MVLLSFSGSDSFIIMCFLIFINSSFSSWLPENSFDLFNICCSYLYYRSQANILSGKFALGKAQVILEEASST